MKNIKYPEKTLAVCMLGRLGDILSAEPAFRTLRAMYPDHHFIWFTKPQFAEILRFAPFPDEIITVNTPEEYLAKKSELPADAVLYEFNLKIKNNGQIVSHPGSAPRIQAPERIKLLENFISPYQIKLLDDTPRFYQSPEVPDLDLPEKYVVFHCTSNGKHRQWQRKKWNQLAEKCIELGFHVVEIGIIPVLTLSDSRIIHRNGIIDLHTAAAMITKSACFVGMESGFGHLANALNVPGIIITGKLRNHPEYNLYTGNYSEHSKKCNLVRFYDSFPHLVPVETVFFPLKKMLSGSPLSYDECTIFCLQEQINAFNRRPAVKAIDLVCSLWRNINIAITAHALKKR